MITAEIKLSKQDVEVLTKLDENGWPWVWSLNNVRRAVGILQRIWFNINTEVTQ